MYSVAAITTSLPVSMETGDTKFPPAGSVGSTRRYDVMGRRPRTLNKKPILTSSHAAGVSSP